MILEVFVPLANKVRNHTIYNIGNSGYHMIRFDHKYIKKEVVQKTRNKPNLT